MLHHASFAVSDLGRSAAFYDAVLSALRFGRVWADQTAVGYGVVGGGDTFAIKLRAHGVVPPSEGCHIAFSAASREAVSAFHRAALENGGRDNGGSGLHPEYGDGYYAAFVFDPDGYRVEAVVNKTV